MGMGVGEADRNQYEKNDFNEKKIGNNEIIHSKIVYR